MKTKKPFMANVSFSLKRKVISCFNSKDFSPMKAIEDKDIPFKKCSGIVDDIDRIYLFEDMKNVTDNLLSDNSVVDTNKNKYNCIDDVFIFYDINFKQPKVFYNDREGYIIADNVKQAIQFLKQISEFENQQRVVRFVLKSKFIPKVRIVGSVIKTFLNPENILLKKVA